MVRYLLAVGCWLLVCGLAPVRAQDPAVVVPFRMEPDSLYGAFFRLQVSTPVAGLDIRLPSGWQIDTLRVLDEEAFMPLTWQREYGAGTRFWLSSSSEQLLVFVRFRTGTATGTYRMALIPLDEAGTYLQPIEAWVQVAGTREAEKPAFGLRVAGRQIWEQSLPRPLVLAQTYEVSGWIRTLHFPAVIMTAWSGREDDPYPFEWLLDERGIPVFYRGAGGIHESLIGRTPVADGTWHRLAVRVEADGWMRLWVDDVVEDSARTVLGAPTFSVGTIRWGGRPGMPRYRGYLDDWRIDGDRPMTRCRMEEGCFSFDEVPPVPGFHRVRVVRTHPATLEVMRVQAEYGWVTLVWEGPSAGEEEGYFVVERALDGRTFETVGTVPLSIPIHAGEGHTRYLFTDRLEREEGVVYYRIRLIQGEAERAMSGVLKVGLAPEAADARSHIIGNYPNPAFHRTQIRYEVKKDGFVRLSLWELSGHLLEVLTEGVLPAGVHEYLLDVEKLPSGTYLLRLETEDGVDTHTLIVMH